MLDAALYGMDVRRPQGGELREARRAVGEADNALEHCLQRHYNSSMATDPHHTPVPAGWLESLARSKADIAAGRSVPLLPILDRLRAAAKTLDGSDDSTENSKQTGTR